ncbi:MAG TPA: alpha-amylase family glycosyl hydrolase [Flavobacteriaceae bacterium]|nr:alpha-amylase family glycosyl hydrolase [Flavobacteriaceae bacterium]
MKKTTIILLAASLIVSCKNKPKKTASKETITEKTLPPVSDSLMETAVIYEANIRQYTPEGTLDEFTADIPQLKELGVKIIWLMPVYPISKTNRKATPELSVEDIDDPNKFEKYLGSYYAISDYTAVNPNFGTKEDFRELVETAHENGMYVILDWVANHTGWDHHWISEHPEFYTKNKAGEITDPIDPRTGESWGWTDVADLNYENKELWKAMTEEMNYWVTEFDVDGFRCDVAAEIPTEFWEFAVPKLEAVKPLFMLAESQDADLFVEAFDMGYNWGGHHLLNEIAQGKADVSEWDAYMQKMDTLYQKDDFLMNFVTNHDENSWNGTIEERLGDASETMLALTYTMPGMPLIYSGQEYDLNHRLKFFVQDTITRKKGEAWPILAKLGELKNENVALHGGKNAAKYERLKTSVDEKILAFKRSKNGEELIYIANMTNEPVKFSVQATGEYSNYMQNGTITLNPEKELNFAAWEYMILTK